MTGGGIATASILSMPYALLANTVACHADRRLHGIFNIFIVLPGGVSMLLAAVLMHFVKETAPETES
jgi:maltose/moltooligosaccharide transporter